MELPRSDTRRSRCSATTSRSTPAGSTGARSAGEVVTPQPGGFYGGWITAAVVGPFKGGPGSHGLVSRRRSTRTATAPRSRFAPLHEPLRPGGTAPCTALAS